MTEAFTIRGAGIVGLCVATELLARGVSVTLRDPAPEPGAHACSWWAGGMLAPFCEGFSAEEPVVRLGQEAADWWAAQGVEVIRRIACRDPGPRPPRTRPIRAPHPRASDGFRL